MITETLSALTKTTHGVLEPVQQLNQQGLAAMEELASRQMDSLKTYTELGVSQLKVMAEVRDVEGLQNLVSKQTDVLKEVGDRLTSDFKAISQMGTNFVSQSMKVGPKAAKSA